MLPLSVRATHPPRSTLARLIRRATRNAHFRAKARPIRSQPPGSLRGCGDRSGQPASGQCMPEPARVSRAASIYLTPGNRSPAADTNPAIVRPVEKKPAASLILWPGRGGARIYSTEPSPHRERWVPSARAGPWGSEGPCTFWHGRVELRRFRPGFVGDEDFKR